MPLFVTFVNVQGSQTQATYNQAYNVFKTYHKLQGSQTYTKLWKIRPQFKTYHKLQGSQTCSVKRTPRICLRHIINYKVLKL